MTINGAEVSFFDNGLGNPLPPGTVFTLIDNTAATPTAGAFANIADGGIVEVDTNLFQANYEGGDGNDLTLMVVP